MESFPLKAIILLMYLKLWMIEESYLLSKVPYTLGWP